MRQAMRLTIDGMKPVYALIMPLPVLEQSHRESHANLMRQPLIIAIGAACDSTMRWTMQLTSSSVRAAQQPPRAAARGSPKRSCPSGSAPPPSFRLLSFQKPSPGAERAEPQAIMIIRLPLHHHPLIYSFARAISRARRCACVRPRDKKRVQYDTKRRLNSTV
jgi:hypothetical protein